MIIQSELKGIVHGRSCRLVHGVKHLIYSHHTRWTRSLSLSFVGGSANNLAAVVSGFFKKGTRRCKFYVRELSRTLVFTALFLTNKENYISLHGLNAVLPNFQYPTIQNKSHSFFNYSMVAHCGILVRGQSDRLPGIDANTWKLPFRWESQWFPDQPL